MIWQIGGRFQGWTPRALFSDTIMFFRYRDFSRILQTGRGWLTTTRL